MMRLDRTIIGYLLATSLLVPLPAASQNIEPLQSINDKIAHIISPTAQPGEVQVATLPATVTWDNDGGRYAFYQLCDTLSAWAPEIKPNGIALSDRYAQYLLGIKTVASDPLADQNQRLFANQAYQAEKAATEEQDRLLGQWNVRVNLERNLPEANKTSYTDFMLNNSANLVAFRASATSKYGQWLPQIQLSAPSTAGRVLSNLLGPAYRVKVKTYSGAELNVLECSPSVNLGNELASAEAAYNSGAAPDMVLSFSHRTGVVSSSWSSWNGSGGWGPFSVSGGGSRSNHSVDTNNFALRLEFPKIIRFNLVRPWFKQTVIDTYKDTSILPGTELDLIKPLFGQSGSFALVPEEFVVAYRPRVVVTMSSSDYSLAKSSYSGGGSFSVGPFRVGGGTSGGSSVEKWDDQGSSVTIGTSANTFVLLGIRNKVLP